MGGSDEKRRVVIRNKKARHDYEILERFEAGVVLLGAEVKSLREGKASFADPFARVEDGEMWLYNLHITPYAAATIKRKLLMQRRQIAKLASQTAERGLTLVPLDLYFTPRGLVKVTLGLAKGKRAHDRRETLKRDEAKREMERAVRRARERA